MTTKTRRILSIAGIALMLIFTIFLVISLYKSDILGGALLYIGIASGLIGIVIYILIMRDNRVKAALEMEAEAVQQVDEKPADGKATEENKK